MLLYAILTAMPYWVGGRLCTCLRIFCWFVHFPAVLVLLLLLLLLFFGCCYFIAIDFRYATDFVCEFIRFSNWYNHFTNSICKSFDVRMSLVCTLHMFMYIFLELKAQSETERKKMRLHRNIGRNRRREQEKSQVKVSATFYTYCIRIRIHSHPSNSSPIRIASRIIVRFQSIS